MSSTKGYCQELETTILSLFHIKVVVPRVLKGDGCDYTYYQSVCSCGWSGDYRASKLTAQLDTCPNEEMKK